MLRTFDKQNCVTHEKSRSLHWHFRFAMLNTHSNAENESFSFVSLKEPPLCKQNSN